MHVLGCLQSADKVVIVSGNNPGALDGFDYEVCTARADDPKCGKFNRATISRPTSLTVSMIGGVAHINQAGGSIFNYSTDPPGMEDPNFARAIPLEVTFTSHTTKDSTSPIYQFEGKVKQLGRCPNS